MYQSIGVWKGVQRRVNTCKYIFICYCSFTSNNICANKLICLNMIGEKEEDGVEEEVEEEKYTMATKICSTTESNTRRNCRSRSKTVNRIIRHSEPKNGPLASKKDYLCGVMRIQRLQ